MSHKHIAFLPILACAVLMGCNSDPGTITSQSSKYEVADEPAVDRAVATIGSRPELTSPHNASQGAVVAAGQTDKTSNPPVRPKPLNNELADPREKTEPAESQPEGPEALVAIIRQLQQKEPNGLTRDEVVADFQNIQRQILQAADMVLKMEASEEITLDAVRAKVESLRLMHQLGADGVQEQLFAFASELQKHALEPIARFGHQLGFATLLDEFTEGDNDDPTQIIAEFKRLFETQTKDGGLLGFGRQVAQRLRAKGLDKASVEVLRYTAAAFQDSEEEDLTAFASQLLEQAKIVESNLGETLNAALSGEDGAEDAFVAVLNAVVTTEPIGPTTFQELLKVAEVVESINNEPLAGKIYEALESGYSGHSDERLATLSKVPIEKFRIRTAIVGKPFSLEGILMDGSPFDWGKYKGKVVLVDYWATWCEPCMLEMPNIRLNYEKYRDQGLEVVGVNLDDDFEQLTQFMRFQQLPWPSVMSADAEAIGLDHPMAVANGVAFPPFMVLLDRDGIAIATNVRGEALGKKLAELFEEPAADPASTDSDKSDSPNRDGEEGSADATPATDDTSRTTVGEDSSVFFVALNDQATDSSSAEADADQESPDADEVNPYTARSDLSAEQLIDFIFDMQEKPKSIQRRDGFMEAIVEAADRVLAADTKEAHHVIATVVKLETLHKKAITGNDSFDRALGEFARSLDGDPREKISRAVAFYLLERKVLEADMLEAGQLPKLLAEAHDFMKERKLGTPHLRLASATVSAINRLEDLEEREKYFKQFGNLFATSRDKQLARYGRQVAGTKALRALDLVGKPIELAGTTDFGTALDWSSYRGRVVLVEFWATWCRACRSEIPHITAVQQRLGDQGFDVIAVSIDEDLEALGNYLEKNQVSWINLIGSDAQKLARRLGIVAVPTMLVIDREGRVASLGHKVSELEDEIERLLATKP